MRLDEFKLGLKVRDRWYPDWGLGTVQRVLKTRVKISFGAELRTYDRDHLQFLEKGDVMAKKAKKTEPKKGDLRVWWIPQVPGKAFHVPVKTLREAKLLIDTLANYDMFQLQHRIKPDYSNAGGLQIYEPDSAVDDDGKPTKDDAWFDWCHPETGQDFDEYCEEHPELR